MWPKIADPILGTLYRGWGKWKGRTFIDDVELGLVIEIPKGIDLEPFLHRVRFVVADFKNLKDDFAQSLFEAYGFHKRLFIEAADCSLGDFQKHPAVESAADVWRVLKPYRLWHGMAVDPHLGNAYLLMNVDWPNPHYFQVFFRKFSITALSYWSA